MGIVLRGENYNTDEVLGDIESFYGMFKKEYERVRDAENKAWKEYAAYKPQTQLNQLKLIYMDALRRGKPIEWAEGKAEGLGLEEEEIEIDEEFQYITELFN